MVMWSSGQASLCSQMDSSRRPDSGLMNMKMEMDDGVIKVIIKQKIEMQVSCKVQRTRSGTEYLRE